jgi:hypothetical protein
MTRDLQHILEVQNVPGFKRFLLVAEYEERSG